MSGEEDTFGFLSERGLSANSLMLDSVSVETLGMAMHNSVTHQQQVHMLNIANLAATCKNLMESASAAPLAAEADVSELPAPAKSKAKAKGGS